MFCLHERSTYDISSGRLLHWEGSLHAAEPAFALAKGENKKGEAAADKQMAMQNALTKEQIALQKQFALPVKDALSKYLSGKYGFDPEQLAILRSKFLNDQSQSFNRAAPSVFDALRARGFQGGSLPSSGDAARNLASLFGMRAQGRSAGLAGIDLQELQQRLSNQFNTGSMFLGIAPSFGNQAVGFGANAGNALNNYVEATKPQPSPWFGVLGAALGAAGQVGAAKVCYIASKLYGGWLTLRTMRARLWLARWAERSLVGRVVVAAYARYGERVAQWPWAVAALKPLFDSISEA